MTSAELIIDDLIVKVRNTIGDEVEEDCSCDSTYMLSAMDCVGAVIRKSYYWIDPSQCCYLVMGNTGCMALMMLYRSIVLCS